MLEFPPTIILRHRRENLKKCSLRGLESRSDMRFFRYPGQAFPPLKGYIILSFDGPLLSTADSALGLFLLDATWRYAAVMERSLDTTLCVRRSLPNSIVTAYPRRQEDCPEPERGLASAEALYIAYSLLGRDTKGLLDNYHWKEKFLQQLSV